MNLEFCDHCGEDFRYDDTGGYNPPCACRMNCRSCCEHGACELEADDGFCPECLTSGDCMCGMNPSASPDTAHPTGEA